MYILKLYTVLIKIRNSSVNAFEIGMNFESKDKSKTRIASKTVISQYI